MKYLFRVSWVIAATLIVSRLLYFPLDGIMWHMLGENLSVPREIRGYLRLLMLLSLSLAIVSTLLLRWERRKSSTRN